MGLMMIELVWESVGEQFGIPRAVVLRGLLTKLTIRGGVLGCSRRLKVAWHKQKEGRWISSSGSQARVKRGATSYPLSLSSPWENTSGNLQPLPAHHIVCNQSVHLS
ncbi:hypothetical protein V6N12_056298 [Hibiscus sabdariffa]|uniref:Uncharacterized protein n=1 Tax=Hibiscus sabdariffa TaxID=183260 RepID=A0ABR2CUM4_9ROSI